jgi:CheY-like chemotaxis protein
MCDLMMPEMTGMDLHAELSSRDPALAERLVFMTGGAFTPAAREFLDRVVNARVEKPFDVPSLRTLIQTLLPR